MRLTKLASRSIDKTWRTYRPWVLPSFHRAYRHLLKGAEPIPTKQPKVYFDFRTNRIDGPQGRRFYGLYIMFMRANYFPVFRNGFLFLANPRNNFKAECFRAPYALYEDSNYLPSAGPDDWVLTDQPTHNHPLKKRGYRVLKISLAVDEALPSNEFAWPFPMFPKLYQLGEDYNLEHYRRQPRPWRFFFGGRSASHSYTRHWVSEVYGKVNRTAYLTTAKQALREKKQEIHEPSEEETLRSLHHRSVSGAVLIHNEQLQTPIAEWLSTLATARFFFACPGVRYPMSHNAVEALATGTVPIIEYPEDFYPPLQDGINCLAFTGTDGLAKAIVRATRMSESDWKAMAEAAQQYYDTYQSPQGILRNLEKAYQERQIDTLKLVPFLKRGGGHI